MENELFTWVNQNFIIRVYDGTKKRLIGSRTLNQYLGIDQLEAILNKLFNDVPEKYTWWDRKSLKIEFSAK